MAKKLQPVKPVGTIGPTRISSSGIQHMRVEFPKTKDEIEAFIVDRFVQVTLPGQVRVSEVIQNIENDFDFKIKTNYGALYLELMEVAPLEGTKGSYENASGTYNQYDFAKWIHTKVMQKSDRYSGRKVPRIALLLYVTDWRFAVCDGSRTLLQYWLAHQKHAFQLVYLFELLDSNSGLRFLEFPTPIEFWKDFDPEKHRNLIANNISPTGWTLRPGPPPRIEGGPSE